MQLDTLVAVVEAGSFEAAAVRLHVTPSAVSQRIRALEASAGQLRKAAVDLARDWRTDRYLRRLEAQIVVADRESLLVLTGDGDVIEPDGQAVAIGSGGAYALAAARALLEHSALDAVAIARASMAIAASMCIYTNSDIVLETLDTGSATR